jgi:DNA-directed RNA polymerase subunit RPC12/RpoP
MNCFPCRGPACNACGKYDRINAAVARDNDLRCSDCGGRVDLDTGRCRNCGKIVIASPGVSAANTAGSAIHQGENTRCEEGDAHTGE